MKRAIIYARVSSRKQADEGVSMDAQIEQCHARAVALGAGVVKVFRDDGISGRTVEARAGFMAALEYCERGDVDYFIVWSTSRFARNAVDLWVRQDALKALGTRLECLNGDIDDDTDAGFINRMFMGTMDQMLSRQIARDTLRSQKKSASEGFWTGGHVPWGYKPVPDGKRTRLVVHEDNAAVVRRAFDLCLTDRLGAQAIALRLNEVGMLRDGKRWGKNSVHYLLKNEVYTGLRTFNKTHKKSGRIKPREEWVQVVSHEALISNEDFERVQTMIEQRTPHEFGGTIRSAFVFSGLLSCGICSEKLQITNGTGRNGTLYNYYGCMAHKKGSVRCLFKKMRAEPFDDWLMAQILDKVLTPAVIQQAMEEIGAANGSWVKDREARRGLMVRELRELEGKRDRLFDLLESHGRDTPDLADVSGRLRQRNAEILAKQTALVELESEVPPGKLPAIDPAVAIEVMSEVVQYGDAKKKRAFLGAFLSKVTVMGDTVLVEYRADALVRIGHEQDVRNTQTWLPVKCPLRTKTVLFARPIVWGRQRKSIGFVDRVGRMG